MQILLGQAHYGEILFANVQDGKIRSIDSYDLIDEKQSYDGNYYLYNTGCGGEWTLIDGTQVKRGMEIGDTFKPVFKDEEIREIIEDKRYYEANGSFCDECGTFHDTDQYYNVSFVVIDCEILCKTCVEAEDMLTLASEPNDLFDAKDMTGFDTKIKGYKVVDTLFCDSSGFGRSNEPALTKEEAEAKMAELLEEHGDLYVGLTGIGQFQVNVTIWKPTRQSKTA